MLRALLIRLRSLMLSRRIDADSQEELQAHLDQEIEANLATGMTPAAARRAAALDVGSIASLTEASRDARGLAWWDAIRGDVRQALRQIRRRPGFAIAVILTLTIAIGATSAVFAVFDAVLLRPLPYPDSQRLYSLYELNSRSSVGRTRATALNFADWRDQSASFGDMAAHAGTGFTLTGRGDATFALGQLVTPNLLDVLRIRPAMGRNFHADETEAGRHRVVVLSHGLWMTYFGGDKAVLNTTTTINGEPYEIVGILPASFAYPSAEYELLAPLVTRGRIPGGPPQTRSARYLQVVGRLADDVTEASARAELDAIGTRLAAEYPENNETVTIGMSALATDRVGDASESLIVVMTSVAFVLLIACVNVAGLAIARGHARRRELAIRAAIGATRRRLVRQIATEGFVLFAIGGALGIALAGWLISVSASLLPSSIPRLHEIAIDARFIGLTSAIVLGVGLLASALSAWQVMRGAGVITETGSRGIVSATRSAQRSRSMLIVAQIAAAIVLLAGAALAVRSLQRVWAADRGFDIDRTLTYGFVLRDARYPTADDMRAFVARVCETIESVPGVTAVGTTSHLPLGDNNLENSFTVDGEAAEGDPPSSGLRLIDGEYVPAIGARVLQGRAFAASDRTGSEPVALVTAEFARRHIRSRPPIGARVKMGGPDSDDPWMTVVGIIADVRHQAIDKAPRPEVWMPLQQVPEDWAGLLTTWLRGTYVAVRTSGDAANVVADVRAAMRSLDPDLPLVNVRSMEDLARQSMSGRRLETSLLVSFAAIAVVLAGVGLFGVLAFHVSQHMQEFGVRLALGATPANLMAGVMRRATGLLAMGLAIGVPGALLMGRAMSALLFGVAPSDPLALALSVGAMALVTFAACALPARRAMRTDPLIAIRES
jgi:putative ABC transport system permease protein